MFHAKDFRLPESYTDISDTRIGNLRLASQTQSNAPSLQKMIEIGIRFEKDIFDKSQNKVRIGSCLR